MWNSKRFLSFFIMLAVLSAFVWALPARNTVENLAIEKAVTPSKEEEVTLSELKEMFDKMDGKLLITGTSLEEVKEKVSSYVDKAESDAAELRRTKFFADIGAAFGFQEDGVHIGATGDMGLRFGSFITKVGVQYMIGNLNDIKIPKWELKDLTVTCSVGWEF